VSDAWYLICSTLPCTRRLHWAQVPPDSARSIWIGTLDCNGAVAEATGVDDDVGVDDDDDVDDVDVDVDVDVDDDDDVGVDDDVFDDVFGSDRLVRCAKVFGRA
jgi:hypothetical protein